MKIKSLLLIALILALFASFFIIRYMKSVSYPDLPVMTDINGQVFDPATLDGKVYIISYFQTWCSDCVKEQPQLAALQEKFGSENLEVLLITDEPTEKIQMFIDKFQPSVKIYHSDKGLKKDLGVRAFPTTYLFGKQGQLLRKTVEGIDWNNEQVQKLIQRELN